jgi:pimeloyl-ACP methyl ester carboxylesterase
LSKRRRVLTVDFRGRGYSDRDPNWRNYHPGTYVTDVLALLDSTGIEKAIIIGTSLGGLCAMAIAAQAGDRVAGVIMNDIGPEINPAGLARIHAYTGKLAPVANWDEAVAQTRAIYGEWLPGLSDADWHKMVWRAYRENAAGVPELDIDPDIGTAVRKLGAQSADPWLLFDALKNIPTILFRGCLSDILTKDIVRKMQVRKPDLEVVTVANRGHVPLLDEPECTAAIDQFLGKVN